MKRVIILLAAMTLLIAAFAVSQATAASPLYVSPSGNNTDCLSPATACTTIQGAINKAAMAGGDTINVAAGTYAENITIDRAITITGSGATIAAPGGTAVTIASDGVTIDGFTVTNPTGKTGIYAADRSNLTVSNNNVNNIGTSDASTSGSNLGIAIVSSSAAVDNITINGNQLSYIAGGPYKSAQAIAIGWSSGNQNITNLLIQNNTISHVTSDTSPWNVGHGAYGIIINHAGPSATGQTVAPQIKNNNISDMEGLWAHGIGLEGNTPNAVVEGNTINNLIDHKSPTNIDAAGVELEDNPSASTVTISGNSFTNVLWGVRNATALPVNASSNWWGDNNPSDNVGSPGGGAVGYSPWLEAVPGTSPMTWGTNGSIQSAVNAASVGDTVNVPAGSYPENVTITKSLTLNGAQAGVDARTRSGSESSVSAVSIQNTSSVTVDGFTFNGSGAQVTVEPNSAIASGVVVKNNILNGYGSVGMPTSNAGNILIQKNLFRNVTSGESLQIKADLAGGCNGSRVLDNAFNAATNNGGADVNLSCTGSNSSNVTVSGNSTTGNSNGSSFTALSGVVDGITISNNTVTSSGSSVFFWGSVSGSALVANNTITNSTGSGVSIHGGDLGIDNPNTGTFTITGNNLTNNTRGIYLASAFGTGSVAAHNNTISGNSAGGVDNASTVTVDASPNYWGSATPVWTTALPGTGPVTHDPWWVDPAMTILSNVQPATVYVDATYTSGSAGGHIFGYDAFTTVQAGVNAVATAGTVNVAAGTYVEAVNVTKTVTLSGQPGAKIKPDNTTPKYEGTRRSGIFISGVNNVTVEGFEIDGTGGEVNYGIYPFNSNNTTVRNNVIHDITTQVNGATDDSAGVGIIYFGWGQGTDNATVSGNTVYNTSRMGIWAGGMQDVTPYNFVASHNNTIENNVVHNAWQGPTADGGGAIQLQCGQSSTLEGNAAYNTGLNWYGIYIAGSSTGNTITGNDIHNNDKGIVIWSNVSFCDWGGGAAGAPAAPRNSIHDNTTYGMRNVDTDGAYLVNAEASWWGNANGPGTVGPGTGDKVSANVDYLPWLASSNLGGPAVNYVAPTGTIDIGNPVVTAQALPGGTPIISASAVLSRDNGGFGNNDIFPTIACTVAGNDISCPTSGLPLGNYTATITATDGSSMPTATGTFTIIDDQPPVTTSDSDGNWHNHDVTVTLSCTDDFSGCASTSWSADNGGPSGSGTGPIVITNAGVTTITYHSTDGLGHVESDKTATVKIDKTNPTITASASTVHGAYTAGDWVNDDVTVTFTCGDTGGSGVASCPAPVTRTATTASTSGTVTDNAGNSASVDFGQINIDKELPTISATATNADSSPYTAGQWTHQDVTVHFTCGDTGGSGLAGSCPADITRTATTASTSGTVSDNAGNSASVDFGQINIDKELPTISATATNADSSPYTAGQWTHQDVTVHFTCGDTGGSGLAGSCPADITRTATTASTSGTVSDVAGNSASVDFGQINIDKVAPSITYTGPTGTVYTLVSSITATASDANSGLQTATLSLGGPGTACTITGGNIDCPVSLATNGTYTAVITLSDVAGNTSTATGTFNYQAHGKPNLAATVTRIYWASYADYVANALSVDYRLTNNSTGITAVGVDIDAVITNNNVSVITGMPVSVGDINAGSSAIVTIQYGNLTGVTQFNTRLHASASDPCGTHYTYGS